MRRIFSCFALALLFSTLLPSCSAELKAPTETSPSKTEVKEETKTGTDETETTPAIMQEYPPEEDDVLNILMIGNSYCYYYVEELYGMAKAAGIDMRVCNVYYSGCPLNKHWDWWQNDEHNYQYFETDERGRKKYENFSLRQCLKRENWDVITLQEGNGSYRRNGLDGIRKEVEPIGKLLEVIREQFPNSKYYWHCTWVPEVGNYNASSNFRIETREDEMAWQNAKITIAKELMEQYQLPYIPTGQAWMEARYKPVIGNRLCYRKSKPDDTSHDGDLGGGQYLNACVWFEMLTGQSCIGNTYRPDYELSEEKIAILQQAAHKTVLSERG
ncbi:MAG: DUF4886 domain-containing protein [Clostridia bacterium]|nr:DUF4886 domain-containing protein [Clostridia bacterium]